MKIWVDDVRPAPDGYIWCRSVNQAKVLIQWVEGIKVVYPTQDFREVRVAIDVIDLDHDAGDYEKDGGDYIKLLDWLEENNFNIPIRIHSMNPVGIENMRRIIRKNGWKEV
jgi:hypothetical protein